MSEKQQHGYAKQEFNTNDDTFVIVYYFILAVSTFMCLLLVYQTYYKIKRIQMKSSYCVISIWINVVSILNLMVSLWT